MTIPCMLLLLPKQCLVQKLLRLRVPIQPIRQAIERHAFSLLDAFGWLRDWLAHDFLSLVINWCHNIIRSHRSRLCRHREWAHVFLLEVRRCKDYSEILRIDTFTFSFDSCLLLKRRPTFLLRCSFIINSNKWFNKLLLVFPDENGDRMCILAREWS